MAAPKTYGEVFVRFTSGPLVGQSLSIAGELKLNRTGGKMASKTNLDGTSSREWEPGNVKFDSEFERKDILFNKDLMLSAFDLVWVEAHKGETHYLTNAWFEGEASESAKTGAVSGLSICSNYSDYRAERR